MKMLASLFCLFILSACSSHNTVPKDILQPEEMKSVLWDTFLADALAQQHSNKDSTLLYSDQVKRLVAEALESNGLQEEEFFKSYNWYLQHPVLFNSILDSLAAHRARINEPGLLKDGRPGAKPAMKVKPRATP